MLTPSKAIEASRFFAVTDSPPYFTDMVPAVLAGTKAVSGSIYLGASLTTLFAKTATADCSFSVGTGSQKEPIIFVDLSLVEMLQLILTIVLPKFVPLHEAAREKIVERMLFHAAVQAGTYSVLDHIAPAASVLEFDDAVFNQEIALRTMIAVDCLAGHELGHWQAAKKMDGADITPESKARIMGLAEAGLSRFEDTQRNRYPDDIAAASDAIRTELEHWWSEGWPEIACDILSMRSAHFVATDLEIPIASFVATIATLYQVMGALRLAGSIIRGRDETAGARSMARSIIFESVINEMAYELGVPPETWKHAVEYRRRANRRFVDMIGASLIARANDLRIVFETSKRPTREAIVESMARHKFAARPQGHVHFCMTGGGV